MFRDFPLYVPDVIFGGAYWPRRLDFDNFHDITLSTEVVNMVSSPDVPTICCELQTGILRGRPKIHPADVDLLLKGSVSQGLHGVNPYLFCGGTNPEGLGVFGSYHDWQAPISPEGKERPHLEPLKSFGRFIKTFGQMLALTEKEFDTIFGFYTPYYATEYLRGEFAEELEKKRNELFFDGMARLLQLAGINYSLKDLERSSIEELLSHPTLWVFCLDFMDEETQMKLVQYVERGGRLIIFPTLPTSDLSCQKKTLLLDGLGIEISGKVRENLVKVKGKEVLVRGETTVFRIPESSARILAKTLEGEPCGLLTKKGKGRALILGFGITHVFDYHIELVKSLVKNMDISPSIVVEPGGVMATVRSTVRAADNEKYGFLFLSNYKDEPENVKISLRLPGEKRRIRLPETGSIYLLGRSASILPLNVPLSENIRIRWSSLEILEYKYRKQLTLLLRGAAGGDGELLLSCKRPKTIEVDGKRFPFEYISGVLKIHFKPNGKNQNLAIRF
jgi:beta-galactosidase